MKTIVHLLSWSDLSQRGNQQAYQQISELLSAGVSHFILDLRLTYKFTGSDLIALTDALRLVQATGGQLVLCTTNRQLKMMLELTGLDQLLNIFSSLDDCRHFFESSEGNVQIVASGDRARRLNVVRDHLPDSWISLSA